MTTNAVIRQLRSCSARRQLEWVTFGGGEWVQRVGSKPAASADVDDLLADLARRAGVPVDPQRERVCVRIVGRPPPDGPAPVAPCFDRLAVDGVRCAYVGLHGSIVPAGTAWLFRSNRPGAAMTATTVDHAAIETLYGLVLEDGRRWDEAATDVQGAPAGRSSSMAPTVKAAKSVVFE